MFILSTDNIAQAMHRIATYRSVETGRRKDKRRVVREPRNVDVVFVNLVECANHLTLR